MANSVAECEQMIAACKKADRKLMIAYRIQYEPNNRLMQKWVREKKYGAVKIIEGVNGQDQGDPNQWRQNKKLAGGGALPDVGLYCLNTFRFLLGEEPDGSVRHEPQHAGRPAFQGGRGKHDFPTAFPRRRAVPTPRRATARTARSVTASTPRTAGSAWTRRFRTRTSRRKPRTRKARSSTANTRRSRPRISSRWSWTTWPDACWKTGSRTRPARKVLQDQRIMEALYASAATGKPVKLTTPGAGAGKLDLFRGEPPKSASLTRRADFAGRSRQSSSAACCETGSDEHGCRPLFRLRNLRNLRQCLSAELGARLPAGSCRGRDRPRAARTKSPSRKNPGPRSPTRRSAPTARPPSPSGRPRGCTAKARISSSITGASPRPNASRSKSSSTSPTSPRRSARGRNATRKKSHVFIFEDEKDWKTFLAQDRHARRGRRVLPTATNCSSTCATATRALFDSQTLAHETTHAVVARLYPGKRWPLWLSEGFAEQMSGAEHRRAHGPVQPAVAPAFSVRHAAAGPTHRA